MSLIFPRLDALQAQVALLRRIVAHELLVGAAALDQRDTGISSATRALYAAVRAQVPSYAGDRSLGPELDLLDGWLSNGGLARLNTAH